MRILAIDQGTSGTKALLVDDDVVVRAAEMPVRPAYGPGGSVEQDPEQLWESVLEAGRAAADGAAIDAIALANQGESVLAWDRQSGRPVTPVVGWQDRRAETVTSALRPHADEVAARTGLTLDPYFSAPKVAWVRRELSREGVVSTTDTWLVHRLAGAFVTDVSTASRSLLLDLDRATWDPWLLDLFGLADEELPTLVACDEVVGTTSSFGGDVPVVGLLVDQQAALLAQGCLAAGQAKCTFGTGAFLLANTGGAPVRSRTRLTASIAWRLLGETAWCLDGQVYTVASAVRWLTDLGVIRGPEDLDSVAGVDSGGVDFVPALAGLGAPWWRPDAKASLHGLTLATGREQLVRAVLDGIAGTVAELVRTAGADLGRPLTGLRVDGGLTRSTALMQSVADLAQLPVEVTGSEHATALGVAVAARLGLDPTLELGAAHAAVVGPVVPTTTYAPSISADRAAEQQDRWLRRVESSW